MVNCSFCNKSINKTPSHIDKYKKHYCNKECHKEHQKTLMKGKNNHNYKDSLKKTCFHCGKEYGHYSKYRKFCSRECYFSNIRTEFVCFQCNKKFFDSPSKHSGIKGSFCSIKCYSESCKIIKECEYCKKEFSRAKSMNIQRFCSVDCLTKIRREQGWMKGSKNSRWLGGISGYRGLDWKEQREKAFVRDSGACQICGLQERIAVHHIVPYRIIKNNRLKNLICLCPKHHGKEETYYRQFKKISSRMLNFILYKNTEGVKC